MRTLSLLLCLCLASCSLIHDLDPDKLPSEDGADDSTLDGPDTPLDSSDTTLLDVPPDSDVIEESDCPSPSPFEPSCPMTDFGPCPDAGIEGVVCTMTEEFGGPALTGDFEYSNSEEAGACASLCQCEGFITMYVPGGEEHYPEYSGFGAPKVRINTSSITGSFTVETRIVMNLDVAGKMAGIYVAQDHLNLLGVAITRDDSHFEIYWEYLSEVHGPGDDVATVSGPLDDVELALERTGDDSYEIRLDGAPYPVLQTLDFAANEVGLFVGNYEYSGLPNASALFDYFCVTEVE
jgi:hypothetical protein